VLIIAAVGIGIALSSGGGSDKPVATRVTVPELAGKTQQEAAALITQAGLTVGTISQQPSTAQQKGTVLSSTPAGGAQADPQAPVALVIGGGPNTVPVPNVIGQLQAGAIAQLHSAGFTGSTSTDPVDSLEPKGTVVTIDPAVGSQAPPDAALRLGISTGTISLPDVRGLTEAAAREQLIAAGLDNGNIDVTNAESDTVAVGNVVSTDPGPRSPVGPKDVITLLVAVAIPSNAPTTTSPATTAPSTAATGTGTPTTSAVG
jgi:beta-lactam-binding protein with PASTA domain